MRRSLLMALVAITACAHTPSEVRTSYPTGQKRWVYQTREGRPHGLSIHYHENGKIAVRGRHLDGNRHGLFEYFNGAGFIEKTVLYLDGNEVWRSKLPNDVPPAPLMKAAESTWSRVEKARGADLVRELDTSKPPALIFTTIDRVPNSPRFGYLTGFGGNPHNAKFSLVSRFELFGVFSSDRWGGYARTTTSVFDDSSERTTFGRLVVGAGALHHIPVGSAGRLSLRLGALVPAAADEQEGFAAGALATHHRVADAVDGFRGGSAVRSSASWSMTRRRVGVQADLGVDWILGGNRGPLQLMARSNVGVGYGIRSISAVAELATSVVVDDPERRLLSAGAGFLLRVRSLWLTVMLLRASNDYTGVNLGVGRDI